jgi:hypothetical protein
MGGRHRVQFEGIASVSDRVGEECQEVSGVPADIAARCFANAQSSPLATKPSINSTELATLHSRAPLQRTTKSKQDPSV